MDRTWRAAGLRKPLHVVLAEAEKGDLRRVLGLRDLLVIGVGSTIGTGIFVLTCSVAKDFAGDWSVCSWVLAGATTLLAALSTCELASRIPSPGGSYAYTYVALGELPACVVGWCLVLEYAVGTAAVSRAWGEKVLSWLVNDLGWAAPSWLQPDYWLNFPAAALQAAGTAVMLLGVKESQTVANIWTALKLGLVAFVLVAGTTAYRGPPTEGLAAPEGLPGVLQGAMAACFGYIGWDGVTLFAGEAIDPQRNVPRAVLGTVMACTALYAAAALVLVAMVPTDVLDTDEGFSAAFDAVDMEWTSSVVSVGELIVLPVVVLTGCMELPRLQYAIARDGLLPAALKTVDAHGNLVVGILASGVAMLGISLVIPFAFMNSICSAGALLAFQITNAAVLLVRSDERGTRGKAQWQIGSFAILSFVATSLANVMVARWGGSPWLAVPAGLFVASLVPVWHLRGYCSGSSVDNEDETQFRVSGAPAVQALSTYLNWYLLVLVDAPSLWCFFGYLLAAVVFYVFVGLPNSVGNSEASWATGEATDAPMDLRQFLLQRLSDDDEDAEDEDDNVVRVYRSDGSTQDDSFAGLQQ